MPISFIDEICECFFYLWEYFLNLVNTDALWILCSLIDEICEYFASFHWWEYFLNLVDASFIDEIWLWLRSLPIPFWFWVRDFFLVYVIAIDGIENVCLDSSFSLWISDPWKTDDGCSGNDLFASIKKKKKFKRTIRLTGWSGTKSGVLKMWWRGSMRESVSKGVC